MPTSLIACVTPVKGKLGIGSNNDLLFKFRRDMAYFKEVTSNQGNVDKHMQNVVVMGKSTWLSIPAGKKPLVGRINVILTKDRVNRQEPRRLANDNVYFMSFETFCKIYERNVGLNVFVIGGEQIYNLFMEQKGELKPKDLYLTIVEGKCIKTPDKFMEPPGTEYKLICISEKFTESDFEGNSNTYRFCKYRNTDCMSSKSDEQNYLELCRSIMTNGYKKDDRTRVGTISEFCKQIRYDISDTIPLFTTKRVAWRHCIEELLWFLKGNTDAKILQEKGVKIWNGNTSREFLDGRGLQHYDEGICGPLYGWQWRFFGAKYNVEFADTTKNTAKNNVVGGVDQIENVVQSLKNDPYSRRHLVCAWNPPQLNEMVLPPCHFAFQFYTGVRSGGVEKELSCHVMMRSNDLFLGHPFNVFSYAVLTHIIGLKTGMKPKELVLSITDAHIYCNHIEAIEEQLKRTPRALPKLLINKRVKDIPFEDIQTSDFDIVGYFPHPVIKAPMAV